MSKINADSMIDLANKLNPNYRTQIHLDEYLANVGKGPLSKLFAESGGYEVPLDAVTVQVDFERMERDGSIRCTGVRILPPEADVPVVQLGRE